MVKYLKNLKFHAFKVLGLNLLLDIDRMKLCRIDNILLDALNNCDCKTKTLLVKRLGNRYSQNEINRCLAGLNEMDKRGLLAPSSMDPLPMCSNRPVVALCLYITTICNLFCNYCFVYDNIQRTSIQSMSESIAEQAIDFLILKSKDIKNLSLYFFGGEPLLNFEVLVHATEYAKKQGKKNNKNFLFFVTTNGTLFNTDIQDYLHKNQFRIMFSIDGPPEIQNTNRPFRNGHGSYNVVAKNLKNFLQKCSTKTISLRATLSPPIFNVLSQVQHLLNEFKIDTIAIEPVEDIQAKANVNLKQTDIIKLKHQYKQLAKWYIGQLQAGHYFSITSFYKIMRLYHLAGRKDTGCGACVSYMAGDTEGNIFPCHRFIGINSFKLGHINGGILYPNIQKELLLANRTKIACVNCWARYQCGGGCHACHFKATESIFKVDTKFCELMRYRIELALGIYATLKIKNPAIINRLFGEINK